MRPPRVLLVDDLDALGADRADARERASWLEAAGASVDWVALAGEEGMPAESAREARHVLPRHPDSLRQVRALASSGRFDLIVVASSEPGGGPVAGALPAGVPARWWPTGIPASSANGWATLGRGLLSRAGLRSLDGTRRPAPDSRLGWSVAVERDSGGRALPLWDGDFVLVPEGLAGPGGARLLEGFAAIADAWSGFDLVAWSHPRSDVARRAEALRVPMRVHHVGPTRRMAEWAWWSQAALAVLTGRERIAGGLVMRALASGCPLLWIAPDPARDGVARWLEREGGAFVCGASARAIAAALESTLAGGDEVARVVARGRELARGHDARALVDRLSACWSESAPARTRAA